MSITGIGSYQTMPTTLYSGQTQSAGTVESGGDADRSRLTAPTNSSGNSGLFTSAISQTLFQIGVTPAAANVATGATPTSPQQQALNSFVQNLFGALQPSNTGKPAAVTNGKMASSVKKGKNGNSDSDGIDDQDTDANSALGNVALPSPSVSGTQQQGTAIAGNLETRLQNLIQQVGSGTSPASEPGANSSEQTLPALQQSYQGLLSSQGVSGTGPSLTNFLQVLSQNLQDAPPTGNLISITA